jgi:hypothetical protein
MRYSYLTLYSIRVAKKYLNYQKDKSYSVKKEKCSPSYGLMLINDFRSSMLKSGGRWQRLIQREYPPDAIISPIQVFA